MRRCLLSVTGQESTETVSAGNPRSSVLAGSCVALIFSRTDTDPHSPAMGVQLSPASIAPMIGCLLSWVRILAPLKEVVQARKDKRLGVSRTSAEQHRQGPQC